MKFYIVDEDISIVHVLENIIEELNLGEVIGYTTDSDEAIQEIILKKPDIILLDLINPIENGLRVIKSVKVQLTDAHFIVISKINTKEVIGLAYATGIEFYINKPINKLELFHVLNNVKRKIVIEEKFHIIENMFSKEHVEKELPQKDIQIRNIRMVFSRLGIMGEKGGEDILCICEYMLSNNISNFDFKINEICHMLNEHPKAMEQRVRRAINKGLVNIASVGIEDYMNENFIRYSNSLYDFENVKAQMDAIRGKRETGGKISVKRFIENLLLLTESSEWSY